MINSMTEKHSRGVSEEHSGGQGGEEFSGKASQTRKHQNQVVKGEWDLMRVGGSTAQSKPCIEKGDEAHPGSAKRLLWPISEGGRA